MGEENLKIHENITIVSKVMEKKVFKKIEKILKKHFFFGNLSSEEIEMVINNMFYAECDKDTFVFKQADKGSCFLVLAEGSVDVIIDGAIKKTLDEYDSFGDLALLYDAPRSASIYATKKSFFWAIDRKTFKEVYLEVVIKLSKENRIF